MNLNIDEILAGFEARKKELNENRPPEYLRTEPPKEAEEREAIASGEYETFTAEEADHLNKKLRDYFEDDLKNGFLSEVPAWVWENRAKILTLFLIEREEAKADDLADALAQRGATLEQIEGYISKLPTFDKSLFCYYKDKTAAQKERQAELLYRLLLRVSGMSNISDGRQPWKSLALALSNLASNPVSEIEIDEAGNKAMTLDRPFKDWITKIKNSPYSEADISKAKYSLLKTLDNDTDFDVEFVCFDNKKQRKAFTLYSLDIVLVFPKTEEKDTYNKNPNYKDKNTNQKPPAWYSQGKNGIKEKFNLFLQTYGQKFYAKQKYDTGSRRILELDGTEDQSTEFVPVALTRQQLQCLTYNIHLLYPVEKFEVISNTRNINF